MSNPCYIEDDIRWLAEQGCGYENHATPHHKTVTTNFHDGKWYVFGPGMKESATATTLGEALTVARMALNAVIRDDWCDRFVRIGNMFIRGVNRADAERLWDYAEGIGLAGSSAMRDAANRGETPDEWIAANTPEPRKVLLLMT